MKRKRYLLILLLLLLLLLVVSIVSISWGSKAIPTFSIIESLLNPSDSYVDSIVAKRLTRTLFGIIAGAALAVSGCLMQAITRNPIADAGILGINNGASLFVIIGITYFKISQANQFIYLGFMGALVTAIFVYRIASNGSLDVNPIKLTIAGAATSIALSSLVNVIMLPNVQMLDSFRFWQMGSIASASMQSLINLLPYFIIGLVMALILAGNLNNLALGDELAIGLGTNVRIVKVLATIAAVLLCGVTTAIAGPIGFVGLMVGHLVKLAVGNNMYLLLPFSAISGSLLLLIGDIIGRIVISPSEIEVGIIMAIIGAPIYIMMIRKAQVK